MSNADRLEQNLEEDRAHLRETLGALENKMSPGRMLDEAMAYFDTGPKAFATDLAAQVRANPLPTLLTGVGLAWLILGDRKAAAPAAATTQPATTTDVYGYVLEPADYTAWEAHDRLQEAEWTCIRLETETPEAHALRLDRARAAALGLEDDSDKDHAGFSDRVRAASDAVKRRGASVRDKLKQASAGARGGAASALHKGSQGTKSAAHAAGDGVHSAMSAGQSAVSAGLRLHETNPIATAAIGVGLGALLGAALPLTRKEEQVLGDAADQGLAMGAKASRAASDAVAERIGSDGDARREAPSSTVPPGAAAGI